MMLTKINEHTYILRSQEDAHDISLHLEDDTIGIDGVKVKLTEIIMLVRMRRYEARKNQK